MGFSFRGKTSAAPAEDEATTTAFEVGSGEVIHPEADLKKFGRLHKWDPFLDVEKLDAVDNVLASGDMEKGATVQESLLLEDSPYPEVRAAVG